MSISDILSIAIELANAVRVVIATYKGESGVIISARQLMRSCQLYEECLTTLKSTLLQKLKSAQFSGKGGSSDFEQSLERLSNQVSDDSALLKQILHETESISKSTKERSYLRNAMTTLLTGRSEKIKALESELMNRVQIVTSLMMKDIFKSASGLDAAVMECIADVDGSFFWHGHFGSERQVSFQTFLEAYQSYLTGTFLFRRLQKSQLVTLLRHTLLDELRATTNSGDFSQLLGTEVTVAAFATWLRRFGPMRDTLTKSAAVSLPEMGACVPWYRKVMSRDDATRAITGNIAKYAQGISPQHLFVVRHSSDPKYQFVISTMPPTFFNVEHYPVINGPMGYAVVGEENDFAPTLLDCVQRQVLDKLFTKAGGDRIVLTRQSIEEWEKVFSRVTAELPADHYANVEELNRAAQELCLEGGAGNFADEKELIKCSASSSDTFGRLFVIDNDSFDASGTASNVAAVPVAVAVRASGLSPASTLASASSTACGNPAAAEIGFYMVEHGLQLLLESGRIDRQRADGIRALL